MSFIAQCKAKGFLYTCAEHAIAALPKRVLHALGLDHSPSRCLLGSCPCKVCQAVYAAWKPHDPDR